MLTLFARRREVGMMRALGTTPGQIAILLIIERLILTTISIGIGAVIGGIFALLLQTYPISFDFATQYGNSIGFMDLVFKAKFSFAILLQAAGYIFLFSMISIAFPVWQISRLKPIEGMKR
jgi:ABC-type antimicrobial peptide transport system permease subunit